MSLLRPALDSISQPGLTANLTANLTASQIRFPDTVVCDTFYGSQLSRRNAERAESLLPWGDSPKTWYLDEPEENFSIPFTRESEYVKIQVDYAGAFESGSPPVSSISLPPNVLRDMASLIIVDCVRNGKSGGFATKGIQNLLDYVIDPSIDIASIPYPARTLFITVTIGSQPRHLPNPGIYDLHVAKALASAETRGASQPSIQPDTKHLLLQRAARWARQAILMRVSLRRWWDFDGDTASFVPNINATDSTNQTAAYVFGDGASPVQASKA